VFRGRYDEFERLARVFKSSAIRRRHGVRPIDWYLTPLGWPERATVYLEGACELFVDAARQLGARSAMSGYPAVGPAACHPDSRLHWHSYVAAPEAALSPRQGHLLSIPVLLRTLALLGYYQGGERTRQLVQDPLWQAHHATPERVGTAAQNAALLGYRKDTLAVLAAMLAVVTLARMRRGYRENRVGTIGLSACRKA
jgi:hypothetical protein